MAIATVNPATGETVREFRALSGAEIESRIERSAKAFHQHRRTSYTQRAEWLRSAAGILEKEKQRFAALMTLEMGKPVKAAADEAAKCATACRYYAEHGERLLRDRDVSTNATRSLVRAQPIGPVLAVMPWNFPFWQVFRFAAPALMAGNTGLLKHASNVPQCALAIEDIIRRAGFPEDVFQTLLVASNQVDAIIADDRVAAATLTGSEAAGQSVASTSGKVIKKTVLELGGSDPFIVMPSADFNDAVSTAVKARTINNGQSCIAAKRFIITDSIYDRFESAFVERMRALKVGEPMDESTDIGPLATEQIVRDLEDQVGRARSAGARVLTGGKRMGRPGYFFEPTVLAGLPRSAPVGREEIFGPVATLYRVRTVEAAIEIANDTPFGLGSSAWTRDRAEQDRFIDELEAGMVFINGMVASDARLPFGGVKRSGYGRELGEFGILEFVNLKTVWIKNEPSGSGVATE
jgi:succinate-semialdehyde dehydrogenase/glutarate-semialdehyde dehydrogenase